MKTDNTLLALLLASAVAARPGSKWAGKFKELQQAAVEFDKRAPSAIRGPNDSDEMIGDLASPGPQTAIGQEIYNILNGTGDGQSTEKYTTPVPALGSDGCQKDTCCVWKYIADEMLVQFRGDSIRCNRYARGAIRLGFHDAGAWKKGLDHGGADGSILLTDEIDRKENKGLEEIAAVTKAWYAKYQSYGIGMADLIQMGANVATVACPLGPRTRTFIGRKDINQPAEPGLLPDANDSADVLINLFLDKTIKPHGLVTLLGAHSTSQQRFFKPERALDPQDSTPGVWDVEYYKETIDPNAPQRVLKFPSDINVAKDPRGADQWAGFTDPKLGQERWNNDYAKEYIRLSLLGVQNINFLTDCTKVLPDAITVFNPPDAQNIAQWANGGGANFGVQIGQLLENGQSTANASLQAAGIAPAAVWQGVGKPVPGAPGGGAGQTSAPSFLGGLTGTLGSTLPNLGAGVGSAAGSVGSGAGAAVGGLAGGAVGGLAGGLFGGGSKPSQAPAAPAAAPSSAPKNIPAAAPAAAAGPPAAAGGAAGGSGWRGNGGGAPANMPSNIPAAARPSEAPAAAAPAASPSPQAAAPAAAPAGNPAANMGGNMGGSGWKPSAAPAAAPASAASPAAAEAAKPAAEAPKPSAAEMPKGMPSGAPANMGGNKPAEAPAAPAASAPAAGRPSGGAPSGMPSGGNFQGAQGGSSGGKPSGMSGGNFGKPGKR